MLSISATEFRTILFLQFTIILKKKFNTTLKKSYISIIADETSDVGHHEQLSIVIRYFNSITNRLVETFFSFKRMLSVDANSIFQTITDVLNDEIKFIGIQLFQSVLMMRQQWLVVFLVFKQSVKKKITKFCMYIVMHIV